MKKHCCVLCLLLLCSCAPGAENPTTKTLFAMDTSVTLSCYGANSAACIQDCEEKLFELDTALNLYDENSSIYRLNNSGGDWCALDDAAFSALAYAVEYASLTSGAFDPSIGSILLAWDDFSGNVVPSDADQRSAALLCDYTKIELDRDNNSVRLGEGQRIALGGIGKGFAADCLNAIYQSHGCTGVINLGGNIYAVGAKPEGSKWRIGIQSPFDRNELICELSLSSVSIVTSGAYERGFYQDGVYYHHIFDPATGAPANSDLASVSIIHESSCFADAISTAVFVMGYDKGLSFLTDNGISAVLVKTDGTITEVLLETP
ncbi:MAG: FAD:protein FMN transferase [Clostridia bacterium]|nr:FAD:protein FMN transferase [Clostridia bacterium]